MFLLKILVNQMCLKIWFKEDECRKPSWQRINWKPRSNLIWNVLKHRCLVLHRESHDVSDASQQSSRLRLKNTLEKWECQYCIHLFIMHIVYISQFFVAIFGLSCMTQIWCCMTSFPDPWSLGLDFFVNLGEKLEQPHLTSMVDVGWEGNCKSKICKI